MHSPTVSIIICTRDRAIDLGYTLQSIRESPIAADLHAELIVVDNGSIDNTAAVVHEFEVDSLAVRYILAKKLGKGHAYNAGIAAAHGEILLWTDDDVRVPPNWASNMTRPIIDGRADAVAGGITFPPRIAQVLDQAPFASRRGWFASHDYLDAANPQAMIGANMAFHRRILEKVPAFDAELGPGALGFRDESLFSLQMKLAGFRLVSNFDTAVEHHFDLSRATREGLVKTARGMGRSYAFLYHHWEHRQYRLAALRLAYARCRLHFVRMMSRISGNDGAAIADRLLRLEETVAFGEELRLQRQRPRKYTLRGLAPIADTLQR